MKRIAFLFFAILGLTASASAQQSSESKWKWGVEGSAGVSHPDVFHFDNAPMFRLGGTAEYAFFRNSKNKLFLHSGLQLDNQNVRTDLLLYPDGVAGGSTAEYQEAQPVSLRIPLQLGYSHSIGGNVALIAKGGVYGSAGLFGKTTFVHWGGTDEAGSPKEVNEVKSIYGECGWPVYEWGLTGQVGLEFAQRYRLMFGTDYGLSNQGYRHLTDSYSNLFQYKNRSFYISAALQF